MRNLFVSMDLKYGFDTKYRFYISKFFCMSWFNTIQTKVLNRSITMSQKAEFLKRYKVSNFCHYHLLVYEKKSWTVNSIIVQNTV